MAAPFRFGLERVRDVRAHAEEQAKERFAADLNLRLRGEASLRAAEERLRLAREEALVVEAAPTSGAELVSRQVWVDRLDRARVDALQRLRGLDARLTSSRESLVDATRDREVLDRLRERQRTAHAREAARHEALELDEIALQAYARRRAA